MSDVFDIKGIPTYRADRLPEYHGLVLVISSGKGRDYSSMSWPIDPDGTLPPPQNWLVKQDRVITVEVKRV